ncbi:MAG: DUF1015 family protein [Gemmatimonadales bacterium]
MSPRVTGAMAGQGLLFAPFFGLRYAEPLKLATRLAPPYDVITPAQRRELVKEDPYNIIAVDLPIAAPGEDSYAYAGTLLASWQRRGVLVRDNEPCAYVLRTTTRLEDGSEVQRTGAFLALAAMPFAENGRVRPHEHTHAGPKEDRRKLTLATGCNTSPIFVLAPDNRGDYAKALEQVTAEPPWVRLEVLGGVHEIWIAKSPFSLRLATFASDSPVYIADGHHRYETAVYLREDRELPAKWQVGAQRTLAHVVSFKDPGLTILPTHRIVEGKPLDRAEVLKAASPYFARGLPDQTPTLTVVFGDGVEAPMMLRPEADLSTIADLPAHPSVRSLGVAVADAVFLGAVLQGVSKTKPTLRYTPSAAEAREAATSGNAALSVLVQAPTLEEMRAVSDAGQFMPPKSTYFVPKVPSGVVMRLFDGEM